MTNRPTRRAALAVSVFIVCLLLTPLVAGEGELIFNGKNLDGWEGNRQYWSVEKGEIVGRTTAENPLKHNTFLVWRGKPLGDFELRLKYRLEGSHGNSGIQYRSRRITEAGPFVVGGYQADIDASLRYTGILYDERGRGILAERGQRVTIEPDGKRNVERFAKAAELAKVIHKDGWNSYRIVAKGPRLQHYINGTLMSEVIDRQEGKSVKEGILALQVHQGPPMVIRFKEIRLKRLKR